MNQNSKLQNLTNSQMLTTQRLVKIYLACHQERECPTTGVSSDKKCGDANLSGTFFLLCMINPAMSESSRTANNSELSARNCGRKSDVSHLRTPIH